MFKKKCEILEKEKLEQEREICKEREDLIKNNDIAQDEIKKKMNDLINAEKRKSKVDLENLKGLIDTMNQEKDKEMNFIVDNSNKKNMVEMQKLKTKLDRKFIFIKFQVNL